MSSSTIKPLDFTIEEATAKDVPYIIEIGKATFSATYGWSIPKKDLQTYLDQSYDFTSISAEFKDTKQNKFIVARSPETGAVVGFLQIRYDTTDPSLPPDMYLIELCRVYVSEEFQNRGIGRKLIEYAIKVAKEIPGCQGAWLGVWEESSRVQRFYVSCGFTEKVGKRKFIMGECVQWDWILMLRF